MNDAAQGERRRVTREELIERAVRLFADRGYDAVTMRELAAECGVTAAAFYHYFPDKETLYREAVRAAFAAGTEGLEALLDQDYDLEGFVRTFTPFMVDALARNDDFRRLLVRELLDGEPEHLAFIGEEVLGPVMRRIARLAQPLMPAEDASLLGYSVVSLIVGHFTLAPLREYLSGPRAKTLSVEQIVEHISGLLLRGIRGGKTGKTGT